MGLSDAYRLKKKTIVSGGRSTIPPTKLRKTSNGGLTVRKKKGKNYGLCAKGLEKEKSNSRSGREVKKLALHLKDIHL